MHTSSQPAPPASSSPLESPLVQDPPSPDLPLPQAVHSVRITASGSTLNSPSRTTAHVSSVPPGSHSPWTHPSSWILHSRFQRTCGSFFPLGSTIPPGSTLPPSGGAPLRFHRHFRVATFYLRRVSDESPPRETTCPSCYPSESQHNQYQSRQRQNTSSRFV